MTTIRSTHAPQNFQCKTKLHNQDSGDLEKDQTV